MSEVRYSPLRLFLIALSVCIPCFLTSIQSFIVSSGLTAISGELGVRHELGLWLITDFTIFHVIAIPLSGRLGVSFGKRRAFLWGLAIFIGGSALCAVSYSWNLLLFSRTIQGVGAGILTPLAVTIIIDHFPANRRGMAIGFWSVCVYVSPSLGPWIGGALSNYHWHWMFWPVLPLGLISILLAVFVIENEKGERYRLGSDYLGFILIGISLAAVQVALDRGQLYDWFRSPTIISLFIVSIVAMAFGMIHEKFQTDPVYHYHMYKLPYFTAAGVMNGFATGIFFSSFTLETTWLYDVMQYPPVNIGLVMIPLGILPPILYPFIGILIRRFDPRFFVMVALAIFSTTFFFLSRINLETSFAYLATIRFFQGIAFPLLTVSNAITAYKGAGEKELPLRIAFYSFTRNLILSLLVALTSTLWIHRTAFFTTRLASRSHAAGERFLELYERLLPIARSPHQAVDLVNERLVYQAKTLALNDVYYLFAWGYIFLAGLLIFYNLRQPKVVKG